MTEYLILLYLIIGLIVAAHRAYAPHISDAEWMLRQLAMTLFWPVVW